MHSQVLFQNDEGITSHSWIIQDTAVSLISFEVKKDMIPHTFENKKTLPALIITTNIYEKDTKNNIT